MTFFHKKKINNLLGLYVIGIKTKRHYFEKKNGVKKLNFG